MAQWISYVQCSVRTRVRIFRTQENQVQLPTSVIQGFLPALEAETGALPRHLSRCPDVTPWRRRDFIKVRWTQG